MAIQTAQRQTQHRRRECHDCFRRKTSALRSRKVSSRRFQVRAVRCRRRLVPTGGRFQLRSDQVSATDLPTLVASTPLQLLDVNGRGGSKSTADAPCSAAHLRLPRPVSIAELSRLSHRRGLVGRRFGLQQFIREVVRRHDSFQRRSTPLDGNSRQLRVSWQADAVDMRGLVGQLIPSLKNRLQGRFSGSARFDATTDEPTKDTTFLKGAGESFINRGVIKDSIWPVRCCCAVAEPAYPNFPRACPRLHRVGKAA